MAQFFRLAAMLVLLSTVALGKPSGEIRTYYIAADEVDWDYAPGGVNKMMGRKFEGYSTVFTERSPHRIGTVYREALYRSCSHKWRLRTWSLTILEFGCSIATSMTTWMREW